MNMKDRRGIERGKCNEGVCSCVEYEIGDGGNLCTYCGHVSDLHTELKKLKPSNITEYPRQENNSLEETILNCVEVNPNPQFDASLTSEYSDMSADKTSSENLLNDIVNESTNSISTQASNFHQIQFSLPTFSPALADYLQGKATQSRIHYYRKLFVSELSVYLNQNNYLVSKNRA
ncbi:hypothetical protein Avbf_13791 [Armadillidium vulgare]|nr:hypothetical protein Avbf_13791 [Armadillidium vulgare]